MTELYMVVYKIEDPYNPPHRVSVLVWEASEGFLYAVFRDKSRAEALKERMQSLYPDTEYAILALSVQEGSSKPEPPPRSRPLGRLFKLWRPVYPERGEKGEWQVASSTDEYINPVNESVLVKEVV